MAQNERFSLKILQAVKAELRVRGIRKGLGSLHLGAMRLRCGRYLESRDSGSFWRDASLTRTLSFAAVDCS
jgi:hypothetical protein